MGKWINRHDKRFIDRASSSTMRDNYGGVFIDGDGHAVSNADWIYGPDMSAVGGQPNKYWLISGDTVGLMNQVARDAVDAAELSDSRDSVAAQLDEVEDVLRAFALVQLDEINVLRGLFGLPDRTVVQLKNAVRAKLGN
ncbi:hypothetical protein LCGC14_3007720 [marine sediment metagenome]|uniref:Uncharacterized protein n=1 Tax=marine sediment metagenome TaxID=412755 RepID=A0A0F8Z6T1_9ZZZZ